MPSMKCFTRKSERGTLQEPVSTLNTTAAMASATPAPVPQKAKAPRTKKPTLTFMLHDPETMASAGKYNSTSHRNAALKAATKGFTNILLRQTNTKTIYRYEGGSIKLDDPKNVPRGGRQIVYSKRPVASFKESFEYNGPKLANESSPSDNDKENDKRVRDEADEPAGSEEVHEEQVEEPTQQEEAPPAKKKGVKRSTRPKKV